MDWVPVSAALLVTGGLALALATILTPSGSSTADTLRLVREQDQRWLAVSAILFLASVCLTLGLPSVLVLFERRGRRTAMAAVIALATGFIGIAGYSMLLVFFRALVVNNGLKGSNLDDVAHEAGLTVFLYGWVLAFYLGELLLAIALLRGDVTPRWVPVLLLIHVGTLALSFVVPDEVNKVFILVFALALAGIGMEATAPRTRARLG